MRNLGLGAAALLGFVLIVLSGYLPERQARENGATRTLLRGMSVVVPESGNVSCPRHAPPAKASDAGPPGEGANAAPESHCDLATTTVDGRTVRSARFRQAGTYRVETAGGAAVVEVVGLDYALLTALGTLILVLVLPSALFSVERTKLSPWRWLLNEPGGGLSLARVQLLVWFVPALVMYAIASVPMLQFAPMDRTLAVLLGLSGATTLLGAAANPKQPVLALGMVAALPLEPFPSLDAAPRAAASLAEPPRLADLVEDWQGQGDFSRYQYLLLSLVGAIVMLLAFLKDLQPPRLPPEFVALVGASQATYLGTKAVKTARQGGA